MKIAFLSARNNIRAESLKDELLERYHDYPPEEADVIVAIGGDGFLLFVLQQEYTAPVYGMNCGSIGFLLNSKCIDGLAYKLENAKKYILHPLRMEALSHKHPPVILHGINEVCLWRQGVQAAKIAINIDGRNRMECLIGDGVLLATPAGSTAYNLSAHGPILPMGSNLLALTPINPFRPRRWRGAILEDNIKVHFHVLEAKNRLVSASADSRRAWDVTDVYIQKDTSINHCLLFDNNHNLEERILHEQFVA